MTDPAAGQVEVPVPPEPAGPDGSVADQLPPEGTVPDSAAPDNAVQDGSAPDGSVPGGSADAGGDAGPVDPEGPADPNDLVDVDQLDQPVGAAAPSTAPMADFRMALVSSVTMDLPSQHPTVLLRELESPRRQLSFSIGLPDAVTLAHALRRIPTPRPLTH